MRNLIFFIFIFASCSSEKPQSVSVANQQPSNLPNIFVNIFEVKTGFWGYEIFIDGKPYIRQEIIPSISGVHYFENKEKARQFADFVAEKIRSGKIPPTLSNKEVDSLLKN